MSGRKLITELAEADQALEELLGTLLAEVPGHTEGAPPDVDTEVVAPQVVVQQPEPVETSLNNVQAEPIQQAGPPAGLVRPDWADTEFKALVVSVGALRFAVPLICLNGIAQFAGEDGVTIIPGQPGWHRGVMRHREEKLVVVDLGRMLQLRTDEVEAQYLLVIGEGRYGLICGAIEEQLTLRPEQVNWRQPADRRDWLLGMLPEQMCVMLDLDRITERLYAAAGMEYA